MKYSVSSSSGGPGRGGANVSVKGQTEALKGLEVKNQERREAAAIREARYKSKMEQYYNKKVRPAGFKPGEFVYRRNEASRVEDQGKLGPKWEGPYRVTEAFENGSYKLQTMEDKIVPRTWHAINLRKCYL
ncbi:hypothetical protein Tco_0349466 [Tanacetum coccineum]